MLLRDHTVCLPLPVFMCQEAECLKKQACVCVLVSLLQFYDTTLSSRTRATLAVDQIEVKNHLERHRYRLELSVIIHNAVLKSAEKPASCRESFTTTWTSSDSEIEKVLKEVKRASGSLQLCYSINQDKTIQLDLALHLGLR